MNQSGFAFPQPLSERYAPQSIGEFVGLDKPRKIMSKFAEAPYPSAWLFVGPSGTGKTTMALAGSVNRDIKNRLLFILVSQ